MPLHIRQARFVKTIVRAEQAPPPRPTAVFAGRSNVGKSSLINRLVGQKGLARTSNTPGRTQEIVYFDIDERWYFVDLPGYGYAKAPESVKRRWGPMIERFLRQADGLRLIVAILDARRDPSADDLRLVQWIEQRSVPYIFAVTKSDKVGRAELTRRLAALQKALGLADADALVPVSARTGAGVADLLNVIREALKQTA
jgi:GTP-binding protein